MTIAERAAEARALSALLAIAGQAGWRLERPGPVLPRPFAGWLYAEAAQLLLLPVIGRLDAAVPLASQGMAEARSDILIASVPAPGVCTLAVGLWRPKGGCWHLPVIPALSGDDRTWLRPADWRCGLQLGGGPLKPASGIWTDTESRRVDEDRAAAWLAWVTR